MSQTHQQNHIAQQIKQVQRETTHITDSIQPTHSQSKDLGIIESKTNIQQQLNVSQKYGQKSKIEETKQDEIGQNIKREELSTKIQTQPDEKKVQIIDLVKTEQASIQVGVSQKKQILPSIQQTYAPQNIQIKTQILNSSDTKNSGNENNNQNNDKIKQQVQIQVGVSSLNQPEKVINQAKQERILSDSSKLVSYLQDISTHNQNQRHVLDSVFEQINKKKMQQYAWYYTLKQYFTQYAGFTKDFYQKCEKPTKQQKVQQLNKFLNIGEQLKDGFAELNQFKKETGNNYKLIYQFITTRVNKDLDQIYNKYINQMNTAQGVTNEKKKQFTKAEQQFKKQGSKIQKMFNRVKEGKKQEEDFFIQISKLIVLQKQSRQCLILWGKQIIDLRQSLINLTQICTNDLQRLLNEFKTQSNILYGIQKAKYNKILASRDQIIADTQFYKLITLTDADYIRYSLESSLKKQVVDITDEHFIQFVSMPQYDKIVEIPNQLLTNLIVKKFTLKDDKNQLINTISGNLVLFNKQTSQSVQRISLKNIKQAIPVDQGIIEIKQKIPGVIFNSKKITKLEFKDGDRAQELICFLSQAESSGK